MNEGGLRWRGVKGRLRGGARFLRFEEVGRCAFQGEVINTNNNNNSDFNTNYEEGSVAYTQKVAFTQKVLLLATG